MGSGKNGRLLRKTFAQQLGPRAETPRHPLRVGRISLELQDSVLNVQGFPYALCDSIGNGMATLMGRYVGGVWHAVDVRPHHVSLVGPSKYILLPGDYDFLPFTPDSSQYQVLNAKLRSAGIR